MAIQNSRLTHASLLPQPMKGMPYNFQWGVEDADSGNMFTHQEDSDGNSTRGQYRVNLPDGRVQVSCMSLHFCSVSNSPVLPRLM